MSSGQPAPAPHRAGPALELLPLAGFLLWLVVGLPWGPHTESFDWIVRLDSLSLLGAAFTQLPSVLSLRPLGMALAWIAYRLGGHDVALAQFVNATLALVAWWWLARAVADRRTFALIALVVGGVCFAGYIFVFHLHGVFYAPLLLFLAALVHLARGSIVPGTLYLALGAAVLTALVHPFALPLVVAFAAGALAQERALRTPSGLRAAVVLLLVSAGAYLLLVPAHARAPMGDPLHGWRVSFATTEVNSLVSIAAAGLAVLAVSGVLSGRARFLGVAAVLGAAALLAKLGWPVLPLWVAAAGLACVVRGRWVLAALLAVCALLPATNPTGSPTYAVFAAFIATAATALTAGIERRLGWLGEPTAATVLALALGLGVALRAGVPVPVASAAARPLAVERERTSQFPILVLEFLESEWGAHPLKFARAFERPSEGNALERRWRPPTRDVHLATWLGHLRGGAPPVGETLFVAFGGDPLAKGVVLLAVHGRVAGDALVFRRPPPGPARGIPNEVNPDERP